MLEGSCHCGQVSWTYSAPLESVTACNCNLCRRYGALWAYGFLGEGISVSGSTSSYSHAKKYNGFNFCNNCGCVTHYLSNFKDEKDRLRIAVNTRLASNPEKIANLPVDHFEGLETFEDLPRDHRQVKDLWF